MKYIYSLILILMISLLNAQNFTFEPTDNISKTIIPNDISDIQIDIIRSNEVDTLWLEYELISNSLPSEWYSGYCDNHGCWGTLPDSGYMSPLFDDLNSYMRLSIHPNEFDGSGMVEYYIYEIGHYEEGMLLTFNIDTPGFVGFQELTENKTLLYPNPFNNQIHMISNTNIKEINVYDMLGSLHKKIESVQHKEIEIDSRNWQKGIYIVEVIDGFGERANYKMIKK